MNYHNIETADMMNGNGLRTVIWLSGCPHHCKNCQNPQTWDAYSGIEFDESAQKELFSELDKDYIKGLTLTGGDPLHSKNIADVMRLVTKVRNRLDAKNERDISFSKKDIWLYTGYTWEEIFGREYAGTERLDYDLRRGIIKKCDVMVDGRYVDSLRDVSAHLKGSTNQKVIDIQKSLLKGEVVLWED